MRFLFPRLTAVALAVVLTAPALAQRPVADNVIRTASLLNNNSVQDELKLTDDQKAAIKKILDERREARGKVFNQVRDELKKAGKRAAMPRDDKRIVAALAAYDKAGKAAEKLLNPMQAKRLKQIYLQRYGWDAFIYPEVQKELKLTKKQIADIKGIRAETSAKAREWLKEAGSDREKRREVFRKVRELSKQEPEKTIKVLTPEQKQKWQEMQGPKFDYKRNPRKSVPTEKKDD